MHHHEQCLGMFVGLLLCLISILNASVLSPAVVLSVLHSMDRRENFLKGVPLLWMEFVTTW